MTDKQIRKISNIPEIKELLEKEIISKIDGSDQFFTSGGMTNLAKYLLQNYQINKEHNLTSLSSTDKGYRLNFDNGKYYDCDDIILSSPLPQTIEILENSHIMFSQDICDDLKRLSYDMCIVLMVKANNYLKEMNKEIGLELKNSNILWIGDNYVKKVSDTVNFYTIHCSPEFSLKKFDKIYDEINSILHIELQSYFNKGYSILSNHKWRYSRPKEFYENDTSLVLESTGFLGLCGDVFTNGRFDGAIQSGISIAEKYLKYEF